MQSLIEMDPGSCSEHLKSVKRASAPKLLRMGPFSVPFFVEDINKLLFSVVFEHWLILLIKTHVYILNNWEFLMLIDNLNPDKSYRTYLNCVHMYLNQREKTLKTKSSCWWINYYNPFADLYFMRYFMSWKKNRINLWCRILA